MTKTFKFITFFLIFSTSLSYANLRFASYNIRNFDYDERSNTPTNKSHLVRTIQSLKSDLIAVQEINDTDEFERMISTQFKGKYKAVLSMCGGAHGQRLGFVYNVNKFRLIKFDEDLRLSNPSSPEQRNCNHGSRPLAIGVFNILNTNKKLVAMSLHLKSGGRPKNISKRFKQHNLLNTIINEYRSRKISNFVIMGDFNSTEYIRNGEVKRKFDNSVKRMGLIDSTKNLKCSAYWWGGSQDSQQYPSMLDHILISPSLITKRPKVESYGHCKKLSCRVTLESQMGIGFDEVSDHCPLVTEL